MGFFSKMSGGYQSSAKVVDGMLVLSLPDAVSPVVWRMGFEKAKTAALEVRPPESGEENGNFTLIVKMAGGEAEEIASYDDKQGAVAALMKASSALENSEPGHIAAQPVQTAIPHGTGGGSASNSIGGWIGGIAGILVLGFLALMFFNAGPRAVSSLSPTAAAGSGGSGSLNRAVIPPSRDDHVYGDAGAAITLIEYSDFECPHCLNFHPTAYQLVDGSGGQINWIFRHAPFHGKHSVMEAQAAECAAAQGGNDMFWRYGDAIFSRTKSGGEGFSLENLVPLAGDLGLDKNAFSACLEDKEYDSKLERHLQEAQAIEIRGTPGIVLYNNNTGKSKVFSGAQTLEFLRAEINGMQQ